MGNRKNLLLIVLLITFLGFLSCKNDTVPKPRGYPRIYLPEKEYQDFDTTFPYKFEYPVYSRITIDTSYNPEPYWINIDYPMYGGRVHLSYKSLNNNLYKYTEDARNFVMKHIPKASGINNIAFSDTVDEVYGLIYNIEGTGAASPYQFYVTDSNKHFLRGALYFNIVPNNDSLAPVIDFIKKDMKHLIETLKWDK